MTRKDLIPKVELSDEYMRSVNAALDKWGMYLDIAERSMGVLTLVLLDYLDGYIARFFDGSAYPEHAALARQRNKVLLRNIERASQDLRRHCAPQVESGLWPAEAVREAKELYLRKGVTHDFFILQTTLSNHLHKLRISPPQPLFDLYLCDGIVQIIDINVDTYAHTLIDIDPVMRDILNLTCTTKDESAEGWRKPLHLRTTGDNKLHTFLRKTDMKAHLELSLRRFARTWTLHKAIVDAVNTFYGGSQYQLPVTGELFTSKDTQVGVAASVLLNRCNKTDFILRATEPDRWEKYDAIVEEYKDYLYDNDLENTAENCHEWKLQSDICGEAAAARVAVKQWEAGGNWREITKKLITEWQQAAEDRIIGYDVKRESIAKIHPDWSPEKVERAVEEYKSTPHERALFYDVEALRHHLKAAKPSKRRKKAN